MLNPGEDFTDLCESYVIFITENDVLGMNKPIYHINRTISGENVQFDDGSHIIYVNGSIRTNDTALGKLMKDLYCTDPDEINYKELSDRVRQFKETEEGVNDMCDILDEMRNDVRIENAKKMLDDGSLSLEKIAEFSGLSIDKVRELAGNKSA